MTSENRLDELVEGLRQVEPRLDDLTRARTGADLLATLRDPTLAPAPRRPAIRRVMPWVAVAAGLAAAAGLVMWARDRGEAAPVATNAPPALTPLPPAPVAPASVAPVGPNAPVVAAAPPLAAGHVVEVTAGTTARVAIGAAELTVYGPGRIESGSNGASATVDADAVLVDRSTGPGALSLRYANLDVRVMHATFALDRKPQPRVTVLRGELILHCPTGTHEIHAGENATCAVAIARTAPDPAPRRVPGPLAVSSDPYTLADSAMRRGDVPAARAVLTALIAADPAATDAATALLDLARLEAPTDPRAALRHLDALDAHPRHALLSRPALHLRCTLSPTDPRCAE